MAITLRHWAALTALGCAALAVAYLPPEPSASGESRLDRRLVDRTWLERLNRAYGETREMLVAVQFRDSLRQALNAARHGPDGVEVAFHMQLPEESRALVRTAMQRLWTQLNPSPGARMVVIVTDGRRWRSTYVLPPALDGHTCVATISLDWGVAWLKNRNTQEKGTNLLPWLRDAVAPCLYYAAFGRPGSAIEAWLLARGFAPAYTADWDSPPPTIHLLDQPERYDYLVYNVAFDGLACSAGQRSRCAPALLARAEYGISSIAGMVHRYPWSRNLPADDRYFAALIHDMGRERFANFWRSSAPVDEAFLAAFGEPVGAWTATWAHNFTPDLPPFGPRPRPIAVFLGLALAAVAVAGAGLWVMRRQVS